MSHSIKGSLKIKCSIDVLKRALINLNPEWESCIQVDPNGRIPLYNYQGKAQGTFAHIILPGKRNPNYAQTPGIPYNDLGLSKNEDGTWGIEVDPLGMKFKNMEGAIGGEVARMVAKAKAKMRGYQVESEQNNDKESTLRIRVPRNKAKEFLKA